MAKSLKTVYSKDDGICANCGRKRPLNAYWKMCDECVQSMNSKR